MRQLLSALSYFSIFFAPFLFPIIIWIVARDNYIEDMPNGPCFHTFSVSRCHSPLLFLRYLTEHRWRHRVCHSVLCDLWIKLYLQYRQRDSSPS